MTQSFFQEPAEHSVVKMQIVTEYFRAWAKIIGRHAQRIGYLDFYAGPGRYDNGEKSTPLLILEQAIADPGLRSKLVSIFNDVDPAKTQSLEHQIRGLPGVTSLTHRPKVFNGPVDDDLVEELESIRMIPSLSFLDPWGYKGLSARLIQAVLKDWGSEVIFFFNYSRINPGTSNPLVEAHMEGLFGEDSLRSLQAQLVGMTPGARELAITVALGEAVNPTGDRYVIPFRFLRGSHRTSHYIVFVTKNELGYRIMKGVMASRGIVDEDGVPLFEYLPASRGRQLRLDVGRPLSTLPGDLLADFRGRTITFEDVVREHHVGRPFLEKHYRQVLLELESQGRIHCDPPAEQRKANTLKKTTVITFPR